MSSYIINAIKQYVIENIDPSQLDSNPLVGLKKKEDLLKLYDPCMLREYVPDYDELEDLVGSVLGDQFTDLLLNRLEQDDIKLTMPNIDYIEVTALDSDNSELIVENEPSLISASISGGDMSISLFNIWEYDVTNGPTDGSATFEEGDSEYDDNHMNKIFNVTFSKSGTYIISLRVLNSKLACAIVDNIIVEVVQNADD